MAQPPQPGCERRDIPGVYWVRPINTIVVDVGGFIPKVLLIKGSYTPPAGDNDFLSVVGGQLQLASAGGPVLSGGLGLRAASRDARTLRVRQRTPCGGPRCQIRLHGGITHWFTRWLAAEATYLKPMETTATGASGTFTFDSSPAPTFHVVGKLAAPIGPVRLYGQAGMNYHQAISRTTDTVAGASQTFELRTHGWDLVFGGGGEGWITHRSRFGEVNFARIKGRRTR
jgi:hypothetical protein